MRKIRTGMVISNKMNKTVVVRVQSSFRHPLYGKVIRRAKQFKVHDPENKCRIGDKVEIVETRPLSKDKRWRVVKIIQKPK